MYSNYRVTLTHTRYNGAVSRQRFPFYGYGDARTHLAAIIRERRNDKLHYVVRDGASKFYIADFDGQVATVATIETISAAVAA